MNPTTVPPHAVTVACPACVRRSPLLRWRSSWPFSGCANIKPYIPPSEGHIAKPQVKAEPDNAIPPPARVSELVPPPKPAAKPQTYSVVVSEVPVKDLLVALARDTRQNIDIHPGITGLVSLNAVNETLPAILERVSKQVNMRYRLEGNTIVVSPDTPYVKTYRVNYVNMTRETTSTIGVTGEIRPCRRWRGGRRGVALAAPAPMVTYRVEERFLGPVAGQHPLHSQFHAAAEPDRRSQRRAPRAGQAGAGVASQADGSGQPRRAGRVLACVLGGFLEQRRPAAGFPAPRRRGGERDLRHGDRQRDRKAAPAGAAAHRQHRQRHAAPGADRGHHRRSAAVRDLSGRRRLEPAADQSGRRQRCSRI